MEHTSFSGIRIRRIIYWRSGSGSHIGYHFTNIYFNRTTLCQGQYFTRQYLKKKYFENGSSQRNVPFLLKVFFTITNPNLAGRFIASIKTKLLNQCCGSASAPEWTDRSGAGPHQSQKGGNRSTLTWRVGSGSATKWKNKSGSATKVMRIRNTVIIKAALPRLAWCCHSPKTSKFCAVSRLVTRPLNTGRKWEPRLARLVMLPSATAAFIRTWSQLSSVADRWTSWDAIPLTNGSDSGSCYFLSVTFKKVTKIFFFKRFFAFYGTFWRYIYIIFQKIKRHNEVTKHSKNQGFSYYFCFMIKKTGSGAGSRSGSVPLTNGSGSGRPKNIQCNTEVKTDEAYQK